MDYGRPPVLTEEERRVNTEKAIAARCRRAEVKQQLHDGKISLEDVLMPGIGIAKATKIMEKLEIASNRKIKGLGSIQSRKLIEYFQK